MGYPTQDAADRAAKVRNAFAEQGVSNRLTPKQVLTNRDIRSGLSAAAGALEECCDRLQRVSAKYTGGLFPEISPSADMDVGYPTLVAVAHRLIDAVARADMLVRDMEDALG